jgi:hypothetical protein
LVVGSEYGRCKETKQRGFEDEARKGIRHSNAQSKNNQSVLAIIPGLDRMIPGVERLKERANKAGQQNERNRYSGRAGSHGFEYSPGPDDSEIGRSYLPISKSIPASDII